MKKILITGSSGLIGSQVVFFLKQQGFEVCTVSRSNQSPLQADHHIAGNILDSDFTASVCESFRPSLLLHLAWDLSPGKYLQSEENFRWVNSSMDLLRNFYLAGGERAVFAGTCFEYMSSEDKIKENTPLFPVSIYAKCKSFLHDMASEYSALKGLSFAWGRIFYTYGLNENPKRLVPYIINNLQNNQNISIRSSHLIRDYMFAGDIAQAFGRLLGSDLNGDVNICTGEGISLASLAHLIASKMQKEHLLTLEEQPNGEPIRIVGDNSRLTKELYFTEFTPLELALEKIIEGSHA